MSNYPMMSSSDEERAPWNEPLDKTVEREVSVSLSFTAVSTVPGDASDEEIKDAIENDVVYFLRKHLKEFKDLSIDELEVIDE